jgi:hypothetical protein
LKFFGKKDFIKKGFSAALKKLSLHNIGLELEGAKCGN